MSSKVVNPTLQQGRGKPLHTGDHVRISRSVVNKQRQVVRFTVFCSVFLCNPLVALVRSVSKSLRLVL